jgi:hypothetical protein
LCWTLSDAGIEFLRRTELERSHRDAWILKKSQYLSLKAKLEAELQQAESTTDGIRRRLEALNLVWAEILCPAATEQQNGERVTPAAPPAVASPEERLAEPADEPGNGSHSPIVAPALSDMIDRIAMTLHSEFGVQDVLQRLAEVGKGEANRTTVAGRLKRLAAEGRLVLVAQGQGRSPSVFVRKEEIR